MVENFKTHSNMYKPTKHETSLLLQKKKKKKHETSPLIKLSANFQLLFTKKKKLPTTKY